VRIALDATYSIDPAPSGIAVYSREILDGLAASYPDDQFLHCYRPKQWRHSPPPAFGNVRRRLLYPPLPLFRADILHALNQRVDAHLWAPAKCIVSTFHDLFVITGEYSSPAFRARFQRQASAAARHSDRVIAVSHFTAAQVASLLHFDRDRIDVVHHGVRLPVETPSSRDNMILCVGAIQIRKNIVRLVSAFERLPSSWRLVLAGSPRGYGAESIIDHIAASPARERITLAGYVSQAELSSLYQRASIFAFPSLDEGFGIPVLEAMAYGIPVVTSNRSALPEVAGDAAILIDPYDVDALHSALRALVDNVELRDKYSAAGRARAELFSWDAAVRRTHAVYEKLSGYF
jgi:glycosyltransferase involved in cell wall biosynthesis